MPIGTGIIYNVGDLILSQVSGSGTSFLETKIAAATSSIVYFDSTARINSASLNSITVGTASYVSGSTSIITNLTASNISASGTGSFGMVGIGTTSPSGLFHIYNSTSYNAILETTTANNVQLRFRKSGTDKWSIYVGNSSNDLTLWDGASDRVTFQNGGNVGIGTTSPGAKLHVNGNGYFASTLYVNDVDPTLYLQCNTLSGTHYSKVQFVNQPGTVQSEVYAGVIGTGGLYLANYSNNGIFFGVSNASGTFTERVRIANDGNVGIGTTSPGALLEVSSSTAASLLNVKGAGGNGILFVSGSGLVGIGTSSPVTKLDVVGLNGSFPTGSGTIQSTGSIVRLRNGDSNLVLDIGGNGGNGNWLQATNRSDLSLTYPLLLNPNGGNVGIGTTSPAQKLDVRGYIVSDVNSNAAEGGFYLGNNGHGLRRPAASNDVYLYTTSGVLYIGTAGTSSQQVTLLNNGNVGIGTTIPGALLHVYGATPTIRVQGSSAASAKVDLVGTYTTWSLENQYVNGANNDMFRIYNSALSADAITINRATNNVGIGATNPAYLLDVSGSSRHGYRAADTHQFTGSVSVSGSVTAASFTGSLSGSITSALTASYLTPANSYTITNLTASNISASLTGSFGIVGIGTASPGYTLEVNGTQRVVGNFYLFNTVVNPASNFSNQRGVGFEASTGKLEVAASGSDALSIGRFGSTGQILDFRYAGTQIGNFSLDTNDLTLATARHLILSSTGNVGIGTSSPSQKLTINNGSLTGAGAVYPVRLSGGTMSSVGDSTGLLFVQRDANDDYGAYIRLYTTQATPTYLNPRLEFGVQTTDTNVLGSVATRMVITGDGYVGIGTTSPTAKVESYFSSNAITFNYLATNLNGNSPIPVYGFDVTSGAEVRSIKAGIGYERHLTNGRGTLHIYNRSSDDTSNFSGTRSSAGDIKISIDNSGNVGIGTTIPNSKLQISGSSAGLLTVGTLTNDWGGVVAIGTPNGNGIILSKVNTSNDANRVLTIVRDDTNGASIFGYTPTGTSTSVGFQIRASASSYFNGGNVGIGTTAPAAKLEISGSSNSVLLNIKSPISGAILYVSGSGAVGIGTSNVGAYTLQVSGSFAATTKSFVIEHPTKAGKKLIYGSLESPYHGIRLTGRDTLVNGKCKIQLPDYMYKLILHDSVNIQLTGIKCNKTLYIDDINVPENYFTIAYDKAIFESYKDYEFFWDFTAIRADVPELITEV